MRKSLILILAAFCCFCAVEASAQIILEPPPDVPWNLDSHDFKELTAIRGPLLREYEATDKKIDDQKGLCGQAVKGTPTFEKCIKDAGQVQDAVTKYRVRLRRFKAMVAQAKAWTAITSEMASATLHHGAPVPAHVSVQSQGETTIETSDGGKLDSEKIKNIGVDKIGRVTTGANSWALLKMPDGSLMRLGPDTVFVPNDPAPHPAQENETVMELVKGSIRRLHKGLSEAGEKLKESSSEAEHKRKAKLKLPTVVVAERGTEYECVVLPDGSGMIKLYAGKIEITSKSGEVIALEPGQMITYTKENLNQAVSFE